MLKAFLLLFLCHYQDVHGYGYRYNFNPNTGETNLWTYLPGHQQPVVYDYRPGVAWPEVYTVPYDGLLPNVPAYVHSKYYHDPHLYRYRGADGKYRYKCKPQAFYSEYSKKCFWRPGYKPRP